ncbi:MAG TPA: TetR/AcrR family transcriptional regulator [Solirubrobacteraceae bacterium]|jgi:AcrR family transcriptional regulator|nr:TetR/AcrR family transcriptional regulator [Solirubrobacteraceae bacterium]
MSGELTTEARILEVASRLFYERGYEATSMRDLAEGVGIRAPSLYNHFADKQAILVRICLDTMREFHTGALECLAGMDNPAHRLRVLINWQVRFEASHPYTVRVADAQLTALDPVTRREVIEVRDAYEQLLTSILAEGGHQGHWRVEDPRVICMGIIGMCKINSWYRDGAALTPEQIGDRYATLILAALDASTRI